MQPMFREDRATQAAARLLSRHGARLNVMKLIKLLYLIDRQALARFGRPVTFDSYVSMPHGPVLSFTLDRINADPEPNGDSYWRGYISERIDRYDVKLLAPASPIPNDQLSDAEEGLIDEIDAEFGRMSHFELRDWCHDHLPEWRDPNGSSTPIEIVAILRAQGFDEQEARGVSEALSAETELLRLVR